MNIDLPTAISILGALVSVGAAVAVTYAKLTAIDTRMGERLEALKERVDGALRDHQERIATTEARVDALTGALTGYSTGANTFDYGIGLNAMRLAFCCAYNATGISTAFVTALRTKYAI